MKNFLISIIFISLGLQSKALAFDHSHKLFDEVLKEHVLVSGPNSRVKYKALKDSRSKLDLYLNEVSAVDKAEYETFSRAQKLSFLINAYNGFTLQVVINNYPINSIKDLGSFFTSVWQQRLFTFFGEKNYLDAIEHEMIRKWFKEPRIHFALVCAAKGCPMLRDEAYVNSRLEEQLDEACKTFLTDKIRNRFEDTTLYISKIFKWYGKDFKDLGGVRKFLSTRMSTDPSIQKQIASETTSISYTDYDWALNDAS